jgi:hypothetical protein
MRRRLLFVVAAGLCTGSRRAPAPRMPLGSNSFTRPAVCRLALVTATITGPLSGGVETRAVQLQ